MQSTKSPDPVINQPQDAVPPQTLKAVVKPPKPMDFFDAMRHLSEGKKIHKLEWGDKQYFGFLENAEVRFHKPDGKKYQWIISEGDLMGKDYIIV